MTLLKDLLSLNQQFLEIPECKNQDLYYLDYRIKRISELYHLSEKEALKAIKTCDKQRAKYHSHYADTTWGDPRSYDFTINSATGLDETAKAIAGFALAVSKN